MWTEQTFDDLGRIISVSTPDTAVVTTAYKGDRVLVTDQQGKQRMSRTNALGHLKDVFEVTPNDPVQYPGIETESFGTQQLHGYKTQYDYDVLDNLVKVTQGTQQRFFMYDSLKRLIRTRNPEQNVNLELNITDSITQNSQWTSKYQYDNNGNLEQKTDARNITITYAYDALNRNTSVNYSNTTIGSPDVPDIQRIYDNPTAGAFGIGRLWQSYGGGNETVGSNVEKTLINSYDALGRPKTLSQRFKTNGAWGTSVYETSRMYDRAGNVTSQTYPSGNKVTYHYDAAGRLDEFAGELGDGNNRTYSSGIIYSPFGGLAKEQFGTATALFHKLFYNNRGQLAEIRVGTSYTGPTDTGSQRGAIINHYSAQCAGACSPTSSMTDNNGNLRQQEHWIPNSSGTMQAQYVQTYDYDALNRLQRVTESANWKQEYTYDRWGNRRIHQTNTVGFPKPNFGVNESKNQLTAPVGFTMDYDAAGNLTTDTFTGTGTGQRVYDADNRMTQAWGGENQMQFYSYNADGQRTRRKINGQETWQLYGFEGELLAEYAANAAAGGPQKEYGYRNGQLLITAEPVGNPTLPLFADDFNDNSLDPSKWSVMFPTGTPPVTEEAQQIRITLAPNTAGYNGVSSNSTFDVTGKMVQVEVAQAVSQAGWSENMLEMQLNPNNTFLINVGGGNLLMRSRVNGVNDQTSIGYDSGAHRHWRIRHDATANTVNFETSADSTVWITRKTVTPGFALTALRIYLVAGAWGTGNGAPGAAKYDNVKLLSSSAGPSSITVPNSGFETPSLGFGNFQYGPTGGSWSFINGAGISAGGSGFTGGAFIPQGSQVAFIQSNGEFSQSLSGFQANTNYVITFVAAQRTNCCNAGGQQFAVYLDGTLLGTFNPPLNGVYTEYSTASFKTTTGAHTLKFVGLNPGGQAGFIDHVRITGSPVIGNGVQWLVSDHLGTPRMIVAESGSLGGVMRHDYLPFGEELFGGTPQSPGPGGRLMDHGFTQGDDVRQQFTSKERDAETGLDYFLARYYSSTQGRFTSADPLMSSARTSNPASWDRYVYALNNPLKYVDPDGMDVNILDDTARDYLLLTLPTNIRDKVKAVIAKGKGNLARGSLDKIKSDDANFAALKELVDAKEITEAATAEKDINGIPFSQETLGEQYESDIQAYMQNNNVSRAEAEKIIPRPTQPNELNLYRGETLTPNGEDGVPASPSGNLRAVTANRQGKSASIPLEEAVVTFGHELYGHAYFFRQGNKTWGGHGPVINAIEDRTRRNYRGGGEQRKKNPANLKPKE
jgi:RHS repeat-associated protein